MPRRICPQCKGTTKIPVEKNEEVVPVTEDDENLIDCPECSGRGWIPFFP